MQIDTIPASFLDNNGNNLITGQLIGVLKLRKLLLIIAGCFKGYANAVLHASPSIFICYFILKFIRGAALPHSPKGLGFRAVAG